ncbi:MAG TPA: hypothetical protein VF316_14555 [Polyangiaceae bacterium]
MLAGCGSGGPETSSDAGGSDANASDAPANDAAVVSDATSPSDAAVADSGVTATGSKPPWGSTLCGSGTFTPADSMNVCQTSNPYFPPTSQVTKACGGAGFAFSGGIWEAWCTPSSLYLFARFDDAVGFDSVAPTGNFEAGNGGGSANAYFDYVKKRIFVEVPNAQPAAKSGKIYLLHFDGITDAGSEFRMVAGVALTWT